MPDHAGFVAAAYAVVLLSAFGYALNLRARRARLQAQLREPLDGRERSGTAGPARGAVTTD